MKDLKTEVKEQIRLVESDIDASKHLGLDTKQDMILLDLLIRIERSLDE